MNGKENWMEQVLVEYARLVKMIGDTTRLMQGDPKLDALAKERASLDNKIRQVTGNYQNTIEKAKHQQADIRAALVDNWCTEDKTFKCPVGTATLRTTRSSYDEKKSVVIKIVEGEQ